MQQKGLAPILIVILIGTVLGLSGYLVYRQLAKSAPPPIVGPVGILLWDKIRQSQTTASANPTISPTPNETANWKIYTTSKFSFKYPPDWYLTNCGNKENILLNPKEQSCATESPSFDINIIPNAFKEPTFSVEQTRRILIAERKIILDGKEVPQADIDTSRGNQLGYEVKYTVTRVPVGSAIYDLILYSDFVLNKPAQKDVYNQILSTFKFTN